MILEQGTYVQKAENVIKKLKSETDQRGKEIGLITTTQIRNLLAMTADIYNEVRLLQGDKLTEDICGRIQYLKIRFLYEAGRDQRKMKRFVTAAEIIKCLDEIGTDKGRYILFSRYMEALVAYHKFYGGKDQ